MKRALLTIVTLLSLGLPAIAQDDDLFGNTGSTTSPEGFFITMNANFDVPAGDMADRFGISYRFGPSVLYKTKSNWLIGVKWDFISGANIREDSLLINLAKDGGILNQQGVRTNVNVYERGYVVGVQAGKMFPVFKKNSAGSLFALTTLGFVQHKIKIFDREKSIWSIRDEYNKGYDRLSNGIMVEEFAGYNYFSKKGYFSFYIGLNISAGFTAGRREFLYDVMRPDDKGRLDILYGVRGGIHIPIFKRKSEEFYFK
ncbi:MAG: hypothetical protein JNL72_07250 [Flavipsychrobacter sp.]|nr:hypothetical protein [Flavipsychrobacter sp.]